jgi:hypothetical protein
LVVCVVRGGGRAAGRGGGVGGVRGCDKRERLVGAAKLHRSAEYRVKQSC